MRSHAVSLMCSNTKCYARIDTRVYTHLHKLIGLADLHVHIVKTRNTYAEARKFAHIIIGAERRGIFIADSMKYLLRIIW